MSDPGLEDLFPASLSESPQSMSQRFLRIQQTSPPDALYHFSIAAPRGWTAVETAGSLDQSRNVQGMLHVEAPDSGTGKIEVGLSRITREVNPSDWTKIILDALNERILDLREYPTPGGTQPDILSNSRGDEGARLRRTVAVRDGGRIWIVSASAKKEEYEKLAQTFLFALANFQLLEPENSHTVESITASSNTARVPLRFEHPDSWEIRNTPPRGTHDVRLALESFNDGRRSGMILIRACALDSDVPERTPAQILNEHRSDLSSAGFSPSQAPWSIVPTEQPIEALWIADTRGSYQSESLALTTVLLKLSSAWVLIGLVSPDRDSNPEWWVINKRAFEIVQQSITAG